MRLVSVAHIGKQHSYQLAEGLAKHNLLHHYYTTIYEKPGSITHLLTRFASEDMNKRIHARKDVFIEDYVIQQYELFGLINNFLRRHRHTAYLNKMWNGMLINLFNTKCIKRSIENDDAIIVFGGYTKHQKEIIRRENSEFKIIVDCPIAVMPYVKSIYKEDIKLYGNNGFIEANQYLWNDGTRLDPWYNEKNVKYWCRNADGMLAGSFFVRDSLIEYGANPRKIKVVPYGINTNRFFPKNEYRQKKKVKFLFVGMVDRRKGIHHLLSVVDELGENCELAIVGNYSSGDPLINRYKNHPRIHFYGSLTQDKLGNIYRECDVFVLPSLAEGLAQVVLEAMNCGLPVIVTENTGYKNIVENEDEGFIIPVSDRSRLKESMQYFMNHRDTIAVMGRKAYETASIYTWDKYQNDVAAAVRELLEDK